MERASEFLSPTRGKLYAPDDGAGRGGGLGNAKVGGAASLEARNLMTTALKDLVTLNQRPLCLDELLRQTNFNQQPLFAKVASVLVTRFPRGQIPSTDVGYDRDAGVATDSAVEPKALHDYLNNIRQQISKGFPTPKMDDVFLSLGAQIEKLQNREIRRLTQMLDENPLPTLNNESTPADVSKREEKQKFRQNIETQLDFVQQERKEVKDVINNPASTGALTTSLGRAIEVLQSECRQQGKLQRDVEKAIASTISGLSRTADLEVKAMPSTVQSFFNTFRGNKIPKLSRRKLKGLTKEERAEAKAKNKEERRKPENRISLKERGQSLLTAALGVTKTVVVAAGIFGLVNNFSGILHIGFSKLLGADGLLGNFSKAFLTIFDGSSFNFAAQPLAAWIGVAGAGALIAKGLFGQPQRLWGGIKRDEMKISLSKDERRRIEVGEHSILPEVMKGNWKLAGRIIMDSLLVGGAVQFGAIAIGVGAATSFSGGLMVLGGVAVAHAVVNGVVSFLSIKAKNARENKSFDEIARLKKQHAAGRFDDNDQTPNPFTITEQQRAVLVQQLRGQQLLSEAT